MELRNEFTVGIPVDEAWALLTDVERIAPCMPGALLESVSGEDYRGVVKVKVGPVSAQYRGVVRFVARDEAAHHAELRAEGRETKGQGNASASIAVDLAQDAQRTRVTVVTDLVVTGRVAQFGRGVLAEVSAKLLGQFVDCLEISLAAPAPPAEVAGVPAPGGAAAPGGEPGVPPSGAPRAGAPGAAREPEPVDLLSTVGVPLAKRALPVLAGLALVVLVWRCVRRRRR